MSIIIIPVERTAVTNTNIMAPVIAIIAIAGWQAIGIQPATAFRVYIHAPTDIVVHPLLRHVIVVVVVGIPGLLYYRGAKLDVYVRLGLAVGACAEAHG